MSSNVSSQDLSPSLATPHTDPAVAHTDREPETASQAQSSRAQQLQKNACLVCRRRKLRCDGATPSCGRCTRLSHECIYNENRRKSGPRRGYVKGLETRLGISLDESATVPVDENGTDILNYSTS